MDVRCNDLLWNAFGANARDTHGDDTGPQAPPSRGDLQSHDVNIDSGAARQNQQETDVVDIGDSAPP
jgi:hypothetical protein